ncbi:D-amino-acid transaminase, partial [Durusdinium trenchii]
SFLKLLPPSRCQSAVMSNGGVKRKLAVLDRDAFLEKSKAARMQRCPQGHFIKAMYSSLVDAIITDPELMVLPLDDHAIVRGHAVFDTCTLANGCVYRLGLHLDRLFTSAKLAKLKLPFGDSEDENRRRITEIVCETCVASGLKNGGVRYFLTAGPGNFGFTSAGCEPAFYVTVLKSEKDSEATGISEALVPESEAGNRERSGGHTTGD